MRRARRQAAEAANRTRGLTFIELLIAIVIVVVVVIAILQLFDKDVEVQRQQSQMAEMQQNLRAAMDLISRDARAASACASVASLYDQTLQNKPPAPVNLPLPIAAVWMPNEPGPGPPSSNLPSSEAIPNGDATRPDGLAVMKCVGNGIVELDTVACPDPPSLLPGSTVCFKQPMGLQDGDAGKFLLIWSEIDTASPATIPYYITARIGQPGSANPIQPGNRTSITPEQVELGPPIEPTNDTYVTFGQHWTGGALPGAVQGTIANFDPVDTPAGLTWKAAMVEWVEYAIDKWGDNDMPHAGYSASTQEGSQQHPLLVRRVNPHRDQGDLVPDWDVIAHDIEDMQVVWIWDPDVDPNTDTTLPGGLEYQAGDPSKTAANLPGGAGTVGVRNINQLVPTPPTPIYMHPQPANPALYPTPVALRKVRVTLLARTRDQDRSLGDKGADGFGFPGIEFDPARDYLQGSAAIPGGVPSPPLYLSAYRRKALTSELTLRNYLPGGLQ